jgi:hypothetical protein
MLTGLRPAFEEEGGAQPQTPGQGRQPFTIPLLLVLSVMSGCQISYILTQDEKRPTSITGTNTRCIHDTTKACFRREMNSYLTKHH